MNRLGGSKLIKIKGSRVYSKSINKALSIIGVLIQIELSL